MTPTASDVIPRKGVNAIAAAMITRLYTFGAIAGGPKIPRAFSAAAMTAPIARRIGESSINRVRKIVVSTCGGCHDGTMSGTRTGAASQVTAASGASTTIIRFVRVDTRRRAPSSSPRAMSSDATGTTAEPMAPAATSWKSVSGIRNAAQNASMSWLAPNSAPNVAPRAHPSRRDRSTPATTAIPARAMARSLRRAEGAPPR